MPARPYQSITYDGKSFSFRCPCGCGDHIDYPLTGSRFTFTPKGLTVRPAITLTKEGRDGQRMVHWKGFLTNDQWEMT